MEGEDGGTLIIDAFFFWASLCVACAGQSRRLFLIFAAFNVCCPEY